MWHVQYGMGSVLTRQEGNQDLRGGHAPTNEYPEGVLHLPYT